MSIDKKQLQITDEKRRLFVKRLFSIFVCLLTCGLYYHFIIDKSFVEIELEAAQKTDFKIYWAGPGEPYSEERMSVETVTPDKTHYNFFLSDIGKIARLRIDTHSYEGEVTVKSILLNQEGWEPIKLSTPQEFGRLAVVGQIADFRAADGGLWVRSTGEDPNFELIVSPEYKGLDGGWLIVRLIVIALLVFIVVYCGSSLIKDFRFVPVLLFGVWMLVIVMAGISKRNVHPDEYVHLYAATYYEDNWLPPVLEDPAIRHTYSAYGVSRLNNGEVYYLFAGKFQKFLQAFNLQEYFSQRMFNVLLFGLIFLYTVKNRYARMAAIPFLISPQLWYVFSYCGSDAFALFFAFLLSCELVNPESLLHHYLKGDKWRDKVGGFVTLSVLLGIIFLLKKNYYPFIAFFYLCLGMKLFFAEEFFWEKKEALLRLLLITFVGLGIFGLRIGADYMVNGLDRQEKFSALQEELAHTWFKPSTALEEKHISINRKAQGATLEELIVTDNWFERTFRSSFGVFGYFTISAPLTYYDLVRWSGGILLIFVIGSVFLWGGGSGRVLSVVLIGFSCALIGASLHNSWVADFQPQGRYLFPIIPMLGMLLGIKYAVVNKQLLVLGVTSMYLLGIYCFVFEALLKIPKVV